MRVDARAAHTRHARHAHVASALPMLGSLSVYTGFSFARSMWCDYAHVHTHAHTRTHTHARARSLSLSLSLAVSSPFLTPFPRLSCALNTVLNCCFNTVLNCCSHSPPPSTLCSATALRCNRGWRQISGRGSLTPLPLSSPDFLTGGRLPGEAKMMRGL